MLHRNAISPGALALLEKLSRLAEAQDFALGGGTALALRFGHRKSVDLDFFSNHSFDVPGITDRLRDLFTCRVIQSAETSLSIILDEVKVDWLTYRYPLLREVEQHDHIRMLSVPDIGAMKLAAVSNRGDKKDFFDVHALLKRHSLQEMLGWYEKKYPQHETFLVYRSLCYFADAEHSPEPISLDGTLWTEVKATVCQAVRELA
ncbi:MAG: nucleotidyl transferase AbiEii/AbiGii toxin family protein [Verrucomicrobiales bacterium]